MALSMLDILLGGILVSSYPKSDQLVMRIWSKNLKTEEVN
uniref:Uncharacterized protein n=1 Tax=Arundo donax TaxID=35708 RepID=A0A0A8ZYM5_ARUDO